MDGVKHSQRIGEPRHVACAPFDIEAACVGIVASEADHLSGQIDPGHACTAFGERDGPLTTAAAGIKEARIAVQPQRIPNAI